MQVSIKNLSKIVSGDFNDPFVDGDTIIVKDGLITEIGDVSEKKINSVLVHPKLAHLMPPLLQYI